MINRIIAALHKVPEKNLLIIELANHLTNADGEMDYDALSDHRKEINLAMAEARAYAKATDRAVHALKNLTPRCGGSL